jgi:hypothetical protein
LKPYPGPPITEDKLRDQLPRGLQHIDIVVVPPYLPREPAEVFFAAFEANGLSVRSSEEFEVDPEIGLTGEQIARLCARRW